jgi:hypothetical protein
MEASQAVTFIRGRESRRERELERKKDRNPQKRLAKLWRGSKKRKGPTLVVGKE